MSKIRSLISIIDYCIDDGETLSNENSYNIMKDADKYFDLLFFLN